MTDTAATTQQTEHFWTRVRSALGAIRPVKSHVPAYGEAEIAKSNPPRNGPSDAIEDILAESWAFTAERKMGMALLVVELDRIAEYFTAYGRDATEDCVMQVMQAVRAALKREEDNCIRLGRASFAVVMPDYPVLMARQTGAAIAQGIRGLNLAHKESHAGVVTASVGVAVANPEGAYPKAFFEAAHAALKKAQRRGMGRVEAIDLRPAQQAAHAKAA